MKNRTGLIVLILICVGLSAALLWTQKRASTQRSEAATTIGDLSNKWFTTDASLTQLRQVNTALETDLNQQRDAFTELTNSYTQLSSKFQDTDNALKSAQDELVKRDARINDLEAQNQALDQQALDLSTAITNLTTQIEDTRSKLAASEGDKAFLESELQRLMAEKAELERQFNDLAVLRAQVAKLKEELNISRRLDWIRRGLFARSGQKGATALLDKNPPPETRSEPKPEYDLNVEINSDGSVRVIPSVNDTNPPAADTNPPPTQ